MTYKERIEALERKVKQIDCKHRYITRHWAADITSVRVVCDDCGLEKIFATTKKERKACEIINKMTLGRKVQ